MQRPGDNIQDGHDVHDQYTNGQRHRDAGKIICKALSWNTSQHEWHIDSDFQADDLK